jgi:polysaccharide pyruvyl transferase CsaB
MSPDTAPPGVVVAGWSGTTNLGDELLLRALLAMLRERGAGATVVSRDPAATTALHDTAAIGLGEVPALVRALRRSAGLVLGPGGILQDETSPFSLPWHLGRALEAVVARRPLVGVGLGAGPLDRRGSRWLVGRALRHHRGIAVRDAASAELLRDCGVTEVHQGADLVFSLPPPSVEPADRIVVCLRPHRPGGHRIPLRQLPESELDPERIAAVAGALDALAASTGLAVHLVALERGRDDRYHELVADRLAAPVTVAVPGLDEVAAEVARARLVVAMRFHAGVLAVLGGRPAVLLGYAPKVAGLAAEAGRGAALVADTPAGYATIPAAAMRVLGRDDDVAAARDHLQSQVVVHGTMLDRLLGT